MSLDLVNPHVTKILLAVEDGDSITRISQKTGGSYGWTHKWIEQLEEVGVIERDNGVSVRDEEFQETFESVARKVFSRGLELDDAYLLPNFSGFEYRYSGMDAVYIWTKGGYQIARNQRDYPIFIDINKDQLEEWTQFFDQYGLTYRVEERIIEGNPGIYYVILPREDGFDSERVENSPVTPLEETVEWATQYKVNFQPALEMLDRMYDLDLGVKYRERGTV